MSPSVLRRLRAEGQRARLSMRSLRDRAAPRLGERLLRAGRRAANAPFRDDHVSVPTPHRVGEHTLDVVADLAAYTKLPRDLIEGELRTRADLSFRVEWHATPEPFRQDHWFYLSAKGYLFANACHFADRSFLDEVVLRTLPREGRVLEFGAGPGDLSLQLAASGFEVTARELSAVQRDFIRFRVRRMGLEDRVSVVDWWEPVDTDRYDGVIAMDVLEHLPDARRTIDDELLPALVAGGALIENSPFVVNVANPMHHEDYGFEQHMSEAGMSLATQLPDGTNVWTASGQRGPTPAR